MTDARVQSYLFKLRRELSPSLQPEILETIIMETEGHLSDAIAEASSAGDPDPVDSALKAMGSPVKVSEAADAAGGGVLTKRTHHTVLAWAAALLLVPMIGDLTMDFSSWLTGTDTALYGIGIPVCAVIGIRFMWESRRVRRMLVLPLLGIILGCHAFFAIMNGWSQAYNGSSVQARGTAYRRLQGLKTPDPWHGMGTAEPVLEQGRQAFSSPKETRAVVPFRTITGYLYPELPPERRALWKNDSRANWYLIEEMQLDRASTYAEARQKWHANSPELLKLVAAAKAHSADETKELNEVVHSSWIDTERALFPNFWGMAVFSFMWVFLLHLIGMVIGSLLRRRGGQQPLAQ